MWDVRQHPRVAGVFADLWQTAAEDLLVSFDGFSLHVPPEQNGNRGWFRQPWMHVDQSYTRNGFECVQGWVTAHPVEEGDATLAFLRGSHAHHGTVADTCGIRKEKDARKDWRKLGTPEQEAYAALGCTPARVRCPAGSLVLWDSRTVHCGVEPERGRANARAQRCVAYVCMQPRARATPSQLAKKREALEKLRMTSHWPAKPTLFPVLPRTYGAPLLPIRSVTQPPRLSALGWRLAGYEEPPTALRLTSEHVIGPEAALRVYANPYVAARDLAALRRRCAAAEQATFTCYGRACAFPRKQLVFGPPYTFSGCTIPPETEDDALVTRCLQQVRALEGAPHRRFCCVVNLYEDGAHYISHHKDDEESVCAGAPIYTFVFGPAKRPFQVRGPDDELHSFDLHHGHVGVMAGRLFQATCTHGVPKRARVTEWRLSVTVRRAAA